VASPNSSYYSSCRSSPSQGREKRKKVRPKVAGDSLSGPSMSFPPSGEKGGGGKMVGNWKLFSAVRSLFCVTMSITFARKERKKRKRGKEVATGKLFSFS